MLPNPTELRNSPVCLTNHAIDMAKRRFGWPCNFLKLYANIGLTLGRYSWTGDVWRVEVEMGCLSSTCNTSTNDYRRKIRFIYGKDKNDSRDRWVMITVYEPGAAEFKDEEARRQFIDWYRSTPDYYKSAFHVKKYEIAMAESGLITAGTA